MKILFLDIETKPAVVSAWQTRDVNVAVNQIIRRGSIMCWAAQWYGSEDVIFDSEWTSSYKKMIKHMHDLLNEADAVCHYNGTSFDMKELNRAFLLLKLPPPSPYKNIDLYRVVRQNFRFISNKLENISIELGIGEKVKHSGMHLWNDVEKKDPEARRMMEEYNRQDTALLIDLFEKLKPWLKNHSLNHNMFTDKMVCPTCGSIKLQKRGYQKNHSYTYQRYQCQECATWFKSNKSIKELTKSESAINI